jgi:hypothetical protein
MAHFGCSLDGKGLNDKAANDNGRGANVVPATSSQSGKTADSLENIATNTYPEQFFIYKTSQNEIDSQSVKPSTIPVDMAVHATLLRIQLR